MWLPEGLENTPLKFNNELKKIKKKKILTKLKIMICLFYRNVKSTFWK